MATKPIAYKNMAGGLGMEIIRIEYGINDHVVWKFSDEKKYHSSIIYYTNSGRAYFKYRGSRHYIDDFMRMW